MVAAAVVAVMIASITLTARRFLAMAAGWHVVLDRAACGFRPIRVTPLSRCGTVDVLCNGLCDWLAAGAARMPAEPAGGAAVRGAVA